MAEQLEIIKLFSFIVLRKYFGGYLADKGWVVGVGAEDLGTFELEGPQCIICIGEHIKYNICCLLVEPPLAY